MSINTGKDVNVKVKMYTYVYSLNLYTERVWKHDTSIAMSTSDTQILASNYHSLTKGVENGN